MNKEDWVGVVKCKELYTRRPFSRRLTARLQLGRGDSTWTSLPICGGGEQISPQLNKIEQFWGGSHVVGSGIPNVYMVGEGGRGSHVTLCMRVVNKAWQREGRLQIKFNIYVSARMNQTSVPLVQNLIDSLPL